MNSTRKSFNSNSNEIWQRIITHKIANANHNLRVKFESKCDASHALLHQENTKIVSNYSRTQTYSGNILYVALIKL